MVVQVRNARWGEFFRQTAVLKTVLLKQQRKVGYIKTDRLLGKLKMFYRSVLPS